MKTFDQINKEMQNLAFAKVCESTLNIVKNLKISNLLDLLNNYNCYTHIVKFVSLANINIVSKNFIRDFSDLLVENMFENFNLTYSEIMDLLENANKLKIMVLRELVSAKYME